MRILIVSDTHRKNDNYQKVVNMMGPLDLIIHCGDAEGSEYFLTQMADCPVQIVLGNSDYFSELPRELEFNIDKYKVWVTHGHNYYVSMGNEFIKREAKAKDVDIVFYGHTHRPVIDTSTEGIIAVNPGSLTFPRQEGNRPSYAIMEIDRFGELHFTIAYL